MSTTPRPFPPDDTLSPEGFFTRLRCCHQDRTHQAGPSTRMALHGDDTPLLSSLSSTPGPFPSGFLFSDGVFPRSQRGPAPPSLSSPAGQFSLLRAFPAKVSPWRGFFHWPPSPPPYALIFSSPDNIPC